MAINTETLKELKLALLKSLGDYLSFQTTTPIGAGTSVISTELRSYDMANDGYFDNRWVYIDGTANAGVTRKTGVTTYLSSSGKVSVYGANLSAESAAVTCYISRYDPNAVERAVIAACDELYPVLHLPIEDITLVTGNILPDASFEDWASSTQLTWYSASSAAIVKASTSTAGAVRNGLYSAKVTPSAASGYMYISSDTYPRLLDLQDQTVDFYCLAYPEVANDPSLVIYTIDSAGSTQTLSSTTHSVAKQQNILELENQTLNDDLEELQIHWRVASSTKYCYFDDALLFGRNIKEYLLPTDFRDGHVSEVRIQDEAHQDPAPYDLHPFATIDSGTPLRHEVIDIGNWRYLRLRESFTNKRRLRLKGFKPLETMSAATSAITIDKQRIPLLIEYAKIIFYDRESKPVSSEDIDRYDRELTKAYQRYYSLYYQHRMPYDAEYL